MRKWEGIFQSGKSQGILNRLEKSRKTHTQNTGKVREFPTNVTDILMNCALFSVKKQNIKTTGKVREFYQFKKMGIIFKGAFIPSGNFLSALIC